MAVDLYPLILRLPIPLQAREILRAYADMVGTYNEFKVGLTMSALELLTGIKESQAKLWRKRCIDAGFLVDSGEREGKTGQIIKYRVAMLPIEDVNLMLGRRATGPDPVPVLAESWTITGDYLLLDLADVWRSGQFRSELCNAGVPEMLRARGIDPGESVRITDPFQQGKASGKPPPLRDESVREIDPLHQDNGVGFVGERGRSPIAKGSGSDGKGVGFQGERGSSSDPFSQDTNVTNGLPSLNNVEPTSRLRARDNRTEIAEPPPPRPTSGNGNLAAREGIDAALRAANSRRIAARAMQQTTGEAGLQGDGAQPPEVVSTTANGGNEDKRT